MMPLLSSNTLNTVLSLMEYASFTSFRKFSRLPVVKLYLTAPPSAEQSHMLPFLSSKKCDTRPTFIFFKKEVSWQSYTFPVDDSITLKPLAQQLAHIQPRLSAYKPRTRSPSNAFFAPSAR